MVFRKNNTGYKILKKKLRDIGIRKKSDIGIGIPYLSPLLLLLSPSQLCLHHYDNINFTLMLNLTWLLVLYVPREPSFVWTQYFVLNLDSWYCLTNFSFFDTPLLYCCISVRSLPISFFWRHISLFRYFLSSSIFFVSNLSLNYVVMKTWNFCNFISDFITSKTPVASANFWIALFEVVSSASVWSRLTKAHNQFQIFHL